MSAKKSQKKKKKQEKNYCRNVRLDKDAKINWCKFNRIEAEMERFLHSYESGSYKLAVQRYRRAMAKASDNFFADTYYEEEKK